MEFALAEVIGRTCRQCPLTLYVSVVGRLLNILSVCSLSCLGNYTYAPCAILGSHCAQQSSYLPIQQHVVRKIAFAESRDANQEKLKINERCQLRYTNSSQLD